VWDVRQFYVLFAAGALVLFTGACPAQEPTTEAKFDLASFTRLVHPLDHPLGKTPAMLVWNLPLPRDDQLVAMRKDGSLHRAIDLLAQRGIVPTVDLGWRWTMAGALAMAQTLQDAGQPVNVLLPAAHMIEDTAYADCPITVETPDPRRPGGVRKWPCLWLARPEKTTAWLVQQLQPLKDAGVKPAGLWFDDEGLPHPWNGAYAAQIASPECKAAYPPEIIGSWAAFRPWAEQFKPELFTRIIGPVRDMFPGAKIGNFADVYSATDSKYGLDASMPMVYANTNLLPVAFKDKPIGQPAVDRFYFERLLKVFSEVSTVKADGKLCLPYVSRFVPDNRDPQWAYGMSSGPYRELLRHLFLRGADSLYLFNMGSPGSGVTPQVSFDSVEDARTVLDEMLARHDFLADGRPLTFDGATPDGILWSGLRLPQQALIRVVSLGDADGEAVVQPYRKVSVTLKAPTAGAWYVVKRDGSIVSSP